jgi:hypothetical protein
VGLLYPELCSGKGWERYMYTCYLLFRHLPTDVRGLMLIG